MFASLIVCILVISGSTGIPTPIKHQSPINIITSDVANASYTPIVNVDKIRNLNVAKITNTGRTVRIEVDDEESQAIITGGPMGNDQYMFVEAHFHWGENSSVGSETQIDGKTAPLELHMVFYNTKYRNKAVAMEMPDGLVVLATLYEISSHNQTIFIFAERLNEIKKSGRSMFFVFGERNFAYFLPIQTNSYYTYHGSLTTPPYSEAVNWIVFTQPMPISEYQLEKFRMITNEDDERVTNNFRDVQNTNERIVYQNTNAADLPFFLFEFAEYALYTDA